MAATIAVVVGLAIAGAAAQRAPRREAPAPLSYADGLIGTGSVGYGRGQNNPGVQWPFGALRLGPDTSLDDIYIEFSHFGGYDYVDTHIRAFSHTHMVGAGLGDYGNHGVMPVRVATPTAQLITDHNYRSTFDHANEELYPGYYAAYLDTHRVDAELTVAGTHAGLHRYTFDPTGARTVLFDACHTVRISTDTCNGASFNATVLNAEAGLVEVRAYLRNRGGLTGRNGKGVDIYLYALVQGPAAVAAVGSWAEYVVYPNQSYASTASSQSLGGYVSFGEATEGANNVVEVRVGLSFISAENAQRNMETSVNGRSFEQVLADTTAHWLEQFSILEVSTPREEDLVKMYTSFYRTLMSPTIYSEWDGSYLGMDEQIHFVNPGENYYSDMSLWDTFRTQNPWLVLMRPDVARDLAHSLVLMIEQGKNLPRWPIANVYTGCMFGDNANMVFLDSYRKGVTNFNLTTAYEAMVANANFPQARDGRGYLEYYVPNGYIPLDVYPKGTCESLMYAYNDWAIGQVAGILGRTEDVPIYAARALNYKNSFDTEELFMCPRYLNGTFFCPRFNQNPFSSYYVEGNVWHYNWDVPHDTDGFIALWPSPEAFVEKLEFNMQRGTEQGFLFEQNWLPNPYYWHGNEHDLLYPWLFNRAGRTDLTQKWTRWIMEHRYTDLPAGLPGNDDYGCLSAWYTFAALGFYPVTGMDWYYLGSPVNDLTRFTLANGQSVVVVAIGNSLTNVYVERITWNDAELTAPYITHAQLMAGGTLTFYMSATPSTAFNTDNDIVRAWADKKAAAAAAAIN